MEEPVCYPPLDPRQGYDDQLYLTESDRIAADLEHLQRVWAAEEAQEMRHGLATGDAWLVSAVLAYSHERGSCWACLLGHECRWHTGEDADALDG